MKIFVTLHIRVVFLIKFFTSSNLNVITFDSYYFYLFVIALHCNFMYHRMGWVWMVLTIWVSLNTRNIKSLPSATVLLTKPYLTVLVTAPAIFIPHKYYYHMIFLKPIHYFGCIEKEAAISVCCCFVCVVATFHCWNKLRISLSSVIYKKYRKKIQKLYKITP